MTSGQAFFDGLAALVEASFPKRCANCGAVYPDAHSFIADTLPISPDRTGLKQGVDERDLTIVEAFRNCANITSTVAIFRVLISYRTLDHTAMAALSSSSERTGRRRHQYSIVASSFISRTAAPGRSRPIVLDGCGAARFRPLG